MQEEVKFITRSLAFRSWLSGYYIPEFEHKGEHMRLYGETLLKQLALDLEKRKVSNINEWKLRRFRLFYLFYPYGIAASNEQILLGIDLKV